MPKISQQKIKNLVWARPPLEEQNTLVEATRERLFLIESIASSIEASLNRLHEFRSALITAAVTGQIDVATWGKRSTTERRLDRIEEEMRA
jgi:type I restriction enzyme S subunit